jgi:ankyrin repeat protein
MRIVLLPLTLLGLSACTEFQKHSLSHHDETSNSAIRPDESILLATYLSRGGDPNTLVLGDTIHGQVQDSLLSNSIRSNRIEDVRLLLDYGANPDGVRGEWEFPLWWAARYGNLAMMKELVTRGANPNTQRGADGTTALHVAISHDHSMIVRYLVDRGADVTIRSRRRNPTTALELAQELTHIECELALTGQ